MYNEKVVPLVYNSNIRIIICLTEFYFCVHYILVKSYFIITERARGGKLIRESIFNLDKTKLRNTKNMLVIIQSITQLSIVLINILNIF